MKLPYRILVLDDDEHALSGIVELLRDASPGHRRVDLRCREAPPGAGLYDLLVSDVRLRGFNGINLQRAEHPEMAFIIVTG